MEDYGAYASVEGPPPMKSEAPPLPEEAADDSQPAYDGRPDGDDEQPR